MQKLSSLLFLIIISSTKICLAQTMTAEQKAAMCGKVQAAARFAFEGYKKYANGFDDLKPVSKQGHNWYATSMLMTPVDAFDTFTLLGLNSEAADCKNLIITKLNFDVDQQVQVFEITIRLLGGLISAYELTKDNSFLNLAQELGTRLLPAFNSKTGMPYRFVNLRTGAVKDEISNPAEIGTLFLEFGKLTQLTGDSGYYKSAKKAINEIYKRRSDINLVGTEININSGKWTNKESHISGEIDSYYEYLYKGWLLFNDSDCKVAWDVSLAAIKKQLLVQTDHGIFFKQVNMNSGKTTTTQYGALDAFFAGLLALSGDTTTAIEVQKANYYMWNKFGIEPEVFDFTTDSILYSGYQLRPENIESCFYLYRVTHDEKYLFMGKRMFEDILARCKAEAGFTSLKDVRTLERSDMMHSFFFAETLKYAYLLFAPETTINLNEIVFNTEAHPLKIMH